MKGKLFVVGPRAEIAEFDSSYLPVFALKLESLAKYTFAIGRGGRGEGLSWG